jgi:hydroxyacylglutathione hydrolase
LQPRELQKRQQEGIVIDTRSPEAFAGAHIRGAYNIWLDGLSAFGGWIANEKTRIFVIVEQPDHSLQAAKALARIGIDTVAGVMVEGVQKWREQGLPIESFATTSAQQCAEWMQEGHVQVLDVRDDMEWDEKHIPGALHAFVGYLEEKPPSLPKDGKLVVHCSVGHRSALACSILRRQGYSRIYNMLGGLKAWEALGLPLETKQPSSHE